jgi:amino-acid N-acetyltransferase
LRMRNIGWEREVGDGREVRVVEEEERGRLGEWAPVIEAIPSAWK